ncbi:MAG: hypothetical protein EOP33_08210 [Rickettsiaceae bacterium]|nr:MAG: hypothetical protein EOP33_08210 [Rickettsiaceae bacterium]
MALTENNLKQYEKKQIKILDSFLTKTIYHPGNLELIKEKFHNKFYGLDQGFIFMDKFLDGLKNYKFLKKSKLLLVDYEDEEVIIYDYREKIFFIYSNDVVEEVFSNIFLKNYFDSDKNILYIKIYESMLQAIQQLKLVPNFLELGTLVNWFLYSLREQSLESSKYSMNFSLKNLPNIFFESSEETHKDFLKCFFQLMKEKNIIYLESDNYEFIDVENSIRLIYGNFDLFWFNHKNKNYIFKTGFELEEGFFEILDTNFDNSSLVNEIKTNNIIFAYFVSSMFCYLAIHDYVFINSIYSDYLLKRFFLKQNGQYNYF